MNAKKVITPTLNNKVIDCPILIATSDSYLPMLKPFCYLFNEFWSPEQPVTFLGYKEPDFDLPDNYNFVSMGQQRGIKFWAEDIRNYLLTLDCDYFSYTAEDMFLSRPVNFESFGDLLSVVKDLKPARFAIGNAVATQRCRGYSSLDSCDIVMQEQVSNYRLSLTWSIWRKDYFMRHLHPNFSPWDFEIKGMPASMNDGEDIVGCGNNFPLGHCNALQSGGNTSGFDFSNAILNFQDVCSHPIPAMRSEVSAEHINKMVYLGLIGEKNKR